MKLKAIAVVVFVAGAGSSYALAGNGHGNPHENGTTTGATGHQKVTLCHKAGNSGRYVKVTVSAQAAKHGHRNDVAPDANGNCPAPTAPAKTEPAKTEPTKTEPTKTEPTKTESTETETEPVTTTTGS